jgi:DNA primase
MIDRDTINRIFDAIKIEEVIGDFVSLRRKGSNWWGLCPFHPDRNPSMAVSSAKNLFKCFSCGKGGNALSFVMEHEHMSYPEALRYLAAKYNIEVVEKELTPEEVARNQRYDNLLVVSDFAQKFYHNLLWDNDFGRTVGLSYFRQRGYNDDIIRKFGLGFASHHPDTLIDAARKEGYKEEYLIGATLCVTRENGQVSDRFYDRVMFPIHSISGRVIAFGGRTLKKDKNVPKYVNSENSEIYKKSDAVYGIFFAKSAIARDKKCYLVEGYTDVISMHQAGITNVVAPCGTALTAGQIRLMKRFSPDVTIIYDNDEAGINASLKNINLLLEEGMNVRVLLLPEGEDPDSFAMAHTGDEIRDFIANNEEDCIFYKCRLLVDSERDPVRKSRAIRDVIETVAYVSDPVLRNLYVDNLSKKYDQKPEMLFKEISSLRRKRREEKQRLEQRKAAEASSEQLRPVYEQQPPPPTEEYYEPAGELLIGDVYSSNTPMDVSEQELVYYLVKFGCYPIHFVEDMLYGAQKREGVTVADYIRSALSEDELELENPLYRSIYEEFYSLYGTLAEGEDYEEQQKQVVRFLSVNKNDVLRETVLGLLMETHPLTVKEYRKAIAPEETILGVTVPKSMILYKLRITEQACLDLTKEIATAEADGDLDRQKALMMQLQMFNQVKNRFARELNRL